MYRKVTGFYNPVKEIINLSCTPHEEKCTQAGGSLEQMQMECTALINQLKRVIGEPPEHCEYVIEVNHHEAGTYYEAAIIYHPEREGAEDYALKAEAQIPDKWDGQALQELRKAGYELTRPALTVVQGTQMQIAI